jgi:cytochrome c-type biogenesis protein CcmE
MDAKRAKFLLLGTGVVLAMAFLLVTAMSGSDGLVYYLTVSEFLERPEHGRGFRVNGHVTAGSIERLPTGEDVRFVMSDGKAALPVAYHGIIPDTFVDEADVVVEGSLRADGVFEAHTLLAKCPSKYESADEVPAAPAREIS